MKDKDLDRLFKSKLSEAAYPYNPDNWARMETLLDARTAGVAPWYWRYSAALVVVGLLLGGLITFQGNLPNGEEATPITSPQPTTIAPESPLGPAPVSTKTAPSVSETAPFQKGQSPAKDPKGTEPLKTSPATAAPAMVSSQADKRRSLQEGPSARKSAKNSPQAAMSNRKRELALHDIDLGPPTLVDLRSLGGTFLPVLAPRDLPDTSATRRPKIQEEVFIPGQSAFAQHQLLVEGGLSQSASFGDGLATGVTAGLRYQWQPTSSFGVSMGVHFRQTGDLSIAIREDTSFFTNQGRQEVSTVKRFRYFQTLNFPVRAQWHINHKHTLMGGAYLGLALRQKARLVTTTRQPKSSPEVEREQISGQHPEFTGTLAGLSLGYTYQLNKRWEAGLQLRYGLSDMTQDRIAPELASFHRLRQADVVLRYRLF